MNHWSNGDPGWSHGPPATDAVTTISYVKAYFNSSNETRTSQWDDGCADKWQGRTCTIPEIGASVNPIGPNSNVTGKTYFFSLQGLDAIVNQTIYPGATAVPGVAGSITPIGPMGGIVVALGVILMGVLLFDEC